MFRLRFGAFEGEFADQNEKTTIAHLPEIRLVKLRFALPHLREQHRIVARLSVQLAEVERARSAVEQQLKAAEALRSAVLRSVFSQNCNEVWPSKRLAEAAEISAGVTLGRKLPDDGVRRVRYLTVANVKDGWLDLTNVKSTDATEREIERGRLVFGDLLLTEGGDPDKLGRGTYWRSELTECILQNHIFRVRFSSDADPDFMSFQFGSDYGKSFFLRHANQTTGIATINRTVLGNFPVLIPSLQVQREVSARISSELKEAEQLRENLLKKLRALEKLPAALLREAFGGRM
jgi:type I restriction enzyme S subunit